MVTLAVLTLSTGTAEQRMSQRYADNVQVLYALEAQGQQFLADLDARIQEGTQPEGAVSTIIGEPDARHLAIELTVTGDTYTLDKWQVITPITSEQGMDDLWGG